MSNVIPIKGHNSSDITPNEDDLRTFMHVVFGGCSGLIPCRSFAEKGNNNSKPISNIWVNADDDLLSKAEVFAEAASKKQAAFYVIPGTVTKIGQAGSADIAQMQVLLIDIDDGDTETKLAGLTGAIGAPTMIVESGGITSEGYKKLHIYWQLTKAVSGDDLQKLLCLRHQIALAAGGDTHFKSAHQPIRVAGSVYHKGGVARSVKVRSYNPVEYKLGELIERISYLPSLNNNTSINTVKTLGYASTVNLSSLLTSKVYEGGNDEASRFGNLQRVIGYWLRRHHDGLITQEQAIEEIQSYNLANVIPSWTIEKIKQTVDGLWKLHLQKYGEAKKFESKVEANVTTKIKSFSLDSFLTDESELPEDIIAPRILTPGGMFVFGGAPKVGKSDFLLSLFVHMAAGKEFLGFMPPRPLKIFYFQAEIGYHYLRERLQNMQLPDELIELAKDNLQITPNSKILLDETGINALAEHIKSLMGDLPDIIAVDPIRNVFDGGRAGATENENDAMRFFLQKRIELLRDKVNPNAGIVLAHHTKKITASTLDEDPFQAFSGASSLRGYYSTEALLYKPELDSRDLHLIFELRNGPNIPTKILCKKDGAWIQENAPDRRLAFIKKGSLYDKERSRRIQVIIELLKEEALKGKFYLMKQFAQKFQNHKGLGGRRAIYDDCSVAATSGLIKFFDNPKAYDLQLVIDGNASFGFMCVEDMKMCASRSTDAATGEVTEVYKMIFPTHYKRDGDGKKDKVISDEIWQVEIDEMEAKNAY